MTRLSNYVSLNEYFSNTSVKFLYEFCNKYHTLHLFSYLEEHKCISFDILPIF